MKDPNRRRNRSENFRAEQDQEEEEDSEAKGKTFPSSYFSVSFFQRRSIALALLYLCFLSAAAFSTFQRFGGLTHRSIWCFIYLEFFLKKSGYYLAVGIAVTSSDDSHNRHYASSSVVLADFAGKKDRYTNHAIIFPDQLLLFLTKAPQISLNCLYFGPSSEKPDITHDAISVDFFQARKILVRCPLPPNDRFRVSIVGNGYRSPMFSQFRRWDFVAYESVLDRRDNSTVIFVKGLNLRSNHLSDVSRFECVFGWQFDKPKYLLSAPVMTIAQEIVRCKTPLSILHRVETDALPILVSVRAIGRGIAGITPTVANPITVMKPSADGRNRQYRMCVCTMVYNQARFLKEWIVYHSRIGVERWFLYDNNSNDSLLKTLRWMNEDGYNVTRHAWPWVKTQEAGFAHCALRARESCEWVGFIDVDEFFHLTSPSTTSFSDILRNHSINHQNVGELRIGCHSFGPSGHKIVPKEGLMVGYTCRVSQPERHKSIVRPETLSPSLLNVVHHFHLREGFRFADVERSTMVINHYKYQVWEIFKEKFYRRVATYVADWQDEENAGSKDRAPGLGTKPVEPSDWSTRFCETNDTRLKDWVLKEFTHSQTGLLPWWT